MSRTTVISRPPSPKDALDPGDSILAHSAEAAQPYRDAAAMVRQRQESGLAPAGSAVVPPPEPSGPAWPFLHVAEQARGKRLSELEAARASLERDLTASAITMSGQPAYPDPGLAQMRQDRQRDLEALAGQIEQLRALEGDALRAWAASQGYK